VDRVCAGTIAPEYLPCQLQVREARTKRPIASRCTDKPGTLIRGVSLEIVTIFGRNSSASEDSPCAIDGMGCAF